ncbi:ATP binding [Balamuthia mandrillaris]
MQDVEPDSRPIVIDVGSYQSKAGFAGEDDPHAIFPSVVGRHRQSSRVLVGMGKREHYVGDEALSKVGFLQLTLPIQRGFVTDWTDMENIWHHTMWNELRCPPEEQPALLAETILSPTTQREKTAQLFFETHAVPALCIASHPLLSLFSSGRTTGLVVECGDGVTNIVPIHEGQVLSDVSGSSLAQRLELAGSDVTVLLAKLLQCRTSYYELNIVRDIKEKHGYVALDFDKEAATTSPSSYELPDGAFITLSHEKFRCAEALFQPHLFANDTNNSTEHGIHQKVVECVVQCGEAKKDLLEKELLANIILCGGASMMQGFAQRLQRELKELIKTTTGEVKVIAPAARKYSAWLGGSMLASLSTFGERCFTREEYEEHGASYIHSKGSF